MAMHESATNAGDLRLMAGWHAALHAVTTAQREAKPDKALKERNITRQINERDLHVGHHRDSHTIRRACVTALTHDPGIR